MKNEIIKKMFLFISLLIIFVGIAYASEADNTSINTDTGIPDDTAQSHIATSTDSDYNQIYKNEDAIVNKNTKDSAKEANSRIPTKVTINPIRTTQYTDNVTISGNYKDTTGRILRYTTLMVKINSNTYTTKTDNFGQFSQSFRTNSVGTNTVSISYPGNTIFEGNTTTNTFLVTRQSSNLTIYPIKTTQYSDYTTISGKFTDKNGVLLRYTPVTLEINGAKYSTSTNKNGIFYFNYKTNRIGTNTVTASYLGNMKYAPASCSNRFTVVNKDTKIEIENADNVEFTDFSRISGFYKDASNNPLRYTTLTAYINGEKSYTKTDALGEFTLYYKSKLVGKNNVTITYPGNARYKGAYATTTFNVTSKTTHLSVNAHDVQYSDVVTITGHYYYNDYRELRYTTINLNINGARYYVKTDQNGRYDFKYKAYKLGLNNITVSYPGNPKFSAASTSATFHVTPKDTRIELIDYDTVEEINDHLTLYGKYVDSSENPLRYTTLTVDINGNRYYTKTDSMGKFSFGFKPKPWTENVVTVSYPGNEKYTGASTTTKKSLFDTSLMLNKIENGVINENVTISGYLKDNTRGYHLYGMPIKITVNGKTYLTTTEEDTFKLTYVASKIGVNNITVSFEGTNKYTKSINKTTLLIKGAPTKITLINTVKSSDGEYTIIKGYVNDYNGNMLKNIPLKLNIDGKTYYTQTNDAGRFQYYYRNTSNTRHTLTVYFEGNGKYDNSQMQITFTPQKEGEFEILTPHSKETEDDPYYIDVNSERIIGNDYFYGWYQLYDGQGPPGPSVIQHGNNNLDDITSNRITGVIFYFKNNNNGNIIHRKANEIWDIYYNTENIPGYTPYKAVVTYRPLTETEIYNYYHEFKKI